MRHLALTILLVSLSSICSMSSLSYAQETKDILFEEEYATFNAGLTTDEIRSNQQEEKRLHAQRRQMRQRIITFRKKNEALQKSLEKTRENLAKTKQYHFEESKILATTKTQHEQLIQVNRSLGDQLNEAERLAQQQRNTIKELERGIVQAKAERSRLTEEKERLKDELIQQRQRLQGLRKQEQKLRASNKELKKQVSHLAQVSSDVNHNLSLLEQ